MNLIKPRKGTETDSPLPSIPAVPIEPYKTPQGDGNVYLLAAVYRKAKLNLIKPRKGTETYGDRDMYQQLFIEPYKTPQGDGNITPILFAAL